MQKYDKIISSYESGLFNKMLADYNALSSKHKQQFVKYLEDNNLPSVAYTLLQYQAQID